MTTPWTIEILVRRLSDQRVVPVLRSASPVALQDDVCRLVEGGFTTIEITTSTPGWPAALEAMRMDRSLGHVAFGVGTVTSPADAERAIGAGARFLVSPYPAPAVRAVAGATPFIEGGFTPGEIAAAAGRGIAKLFPAHTAGKGHLRSILDVLPEALIVPTGGLRLDDVEDWLAAGALAVGLGSDLTSKPVQQLRTALHRWHQIPARAIRASTTSLQSPQTSVGTSGTEGQPITSQAKETQ
jgi:2-dehydro-3-deoxyphosphogluconate aldolase/(4S)-4-hydroxy-2-oxoglutarate aldolase